MLFWHNHARIQIVLSEGVQLNSGNVFLKMMGEERIQISLKEGHQWPASETPFKWRAINDPTLDADLVVCDFFKGSEPIFLRDPIAL